MPEKMIFAPMVQENGKPFTAFQKPVGEKGRYVAGDWVEPESIPVPSFGVILLFSDDDLRYSEAGTYSTKDRKLYTIDPLEQGQEIEYKGIRYTVQQFKDYSDYADVFIYVARWAGNADNSV
ncbi:hypothetical protein [Domibacillus iocasae]|uniref:Phage head-tail adapter protein n=1 Tax=Domibacillus iocasae TaxID=1714016 RepID=A0A1E7DQ71_9BACI|nr:hypothetical protein [Domibacillus iocasae]OES45232.1 hypothetical protein BA724_04280 [Domibacillus iocasae]